MKVKVQILSVESRKSNKNNVVYHEAVCLDMDQGADRMKNTFDYSLSQMDVEAFPNPQELENQVIELGLNDVGTGFGGRFRFRGRIITQPKK